MCIRDRLAYTYDKTSCGLIDAHEFAEDPDALDVHWRATQAVLPYLPEKALSRAEQRARPHKMIADTWDETYTLPENFFLAYQRSGNSRYRDPVSYTHLQRAAACRTTSSAAHHGAN